MDDTTFDLLKRIDAGFERGSGPYGGLMHDGRVAALGTHGDEGFNLRMEVMRMVEAEKEARKPIQATVESTPRAEIVDLVAALKASLAVQGQRP